jgi:hypothetical protein
MKKIYLLIILGIFLLIGIITTMPTVKSFDWSDDIVGYWKLDETTGTIAEDEISSNNGSNTGVIIGEDGKIGKSYNYSGDVSSITDFGRNAEFDQTFAGSSDFAISLWVYPTSSGTQETIFAYAQNTSEGPFTISRIVNESIRLYLATPTVWTIKDTGLLIPANSWSHIIVNRKVSTISVYVDTVLGVNTTLSANFSTAYTTRTLKAGSYGGGTSFKGSIDEIGIWNRSLNYSEIQELWNFGDGLIYNISVVDTLINISLLFPTNNLIMTSAGANFSTNFSIQGTNLNNLTWKNATFNVWNYSGNLFNSTTITLSGNQTNNTLFIDDFILGNYFWNVYGCYGNTTYTNCSWSNDGNFTFQYRPFNLDNQTYTSTNIYETSKQTYTANITTIPTILNVISRFVYNGTEIKTATTNCLSGVCYINISFDIPLVYAETINATSYWNITLFDGTSSYSFNTIESSFVQNVSRIHLELCNTTYPTQTLNFTAWNEKNLTRINKFSFAGSFETWLGSGTVRRNQSFQNTSVDSQFTLCLIPNLTIFTDAQIRYAFDNENESYITRDYYFQNASITNSSQDIRLYLLEAEDSTTFIVKAQDQKLSYVQDALVYIQRYYPEDGTFKTVQIAKTDSSGETIGFYETEIPDYKHIIIKNGVILLETSPQKVVGKEVPFTLLFTVGSALNYPWSVFEPNPNILTSLTYNQTTKLVSFTYIDSTGSTTLGRLTILELSKSNNTVRVIYNSSSSESSATLTYNMSAEGEGNFVAYGYIQATNSNVYNFIIATAKDILDRTGLLVGFFIILTAGFAFIWNPTAGVVGVEGSIILVSVMGLISFSPVFIFASLAIAILALILLKS